MADVVGGIVIAAVWTLLCYGLSRLGGWRDLARHYLAGSRFHGRRLHFQGVQFAGWVGYNGSFTPGADSMGLYLSVWPIFRIAHPPLYVPWSEIETNVQERRFISVVSFRFAASPATRMRTTLRLARRLAELSSGSFNPGTR